MATPEKHRGIKEEWLNLPRRRCDNCGASYKPNHPKQRFCKDLCRWQFSRNGSAILQLQEKIAPEVRKLIRLEESCPRCKGTGTVIQEKRDGLYNPTKIVCETCINGRVLTPFGRDVLALVTSGHVKELQK